MDELPSHTLHAQQGFEFADVFSYKFGRRPVGAPPRRLVLREPDGPSTAGGKRARQPMVLENDQRDAIVCGWVDLPGQSAEVRSFGYVSEQFRARKGHLIDVPKAAYDELMSEVAAFLRVQRLDVQRAERAPEAAGATASGGVSLWVVLGLGIVAGVVLGYAFFG